MKTLRPFPRPPFFWYGLFYVPQGGTPDIAGKCPFYGGANEGILFHSGDNDASGKPDCFISTKWTSIDLGGDDDADGKVDWWVYKYDVDSMTPTATNFEFPGYPNGIELSLTTMTFALDSGASFNDIPPVLDLNNIPDGEPMIGADRAFCDLDRDGDCDTIDIEVFNGALGKCIGEAGYTPDADFNGDGCVTLTDQQYLFPMPSSQPIYLPIILKNTP